MKKITVSRFGYFVYCIFNSDGGKRAAYLKKRRAFAAIGENVRIQPYLIPADAKRVTLHNNISIATGVSFVAHDIIHHVINNMYLDSEPVKTHYAPIEIFDNVFIGANALILSGVKIGPNAIVAAGTVVHKDVPSGTVVGGNPMKVIGDFEKLVNKRRNI